MIGQKNNIKLINSQIKSKSFPRFSIIVGATGSGKKTLTNYIIDKMKIQLVYNSGISVSQVRDTITYMHKVVDPTVVTFYDADIMSVQAKNALLKVAEETPNNVYIIMTVTDLNNVLDTIKSRAYIYSMQPYTADEIDTYYHDYGVDRSTDVRNIVRNLCETPGEIELLCKNGASELFDYAELAVDNIATVNGANAFKMARKIAFKDDEEGFDMQLFLKAFRHICMYRMGNACIDGVHEDIVKYGAGLDVINNIIGQLHITGISKSALFDIFILDIRKAWM